MKTITKSFVILILLLSAFNHANAQGGYFYSTDEGFFSVQFPTAFEETKQETVNGITVKISAEKDGQNYYASYTLHNTEMVDHEGMAEVSLDTFIETLGGELISKSEWNVNGHKGLIGFVALPANDAYLEYRALLIGDIQYQIIVVGLTASYNHEEAKAFFDSLEFSEM